MFKIDLDELEETEKVKYLRVKNMSQVEFLKVQAYWAVDENFDKLQNLDFLPYYKKYKIVNINLSTLIMTADFEGLEKQQLITDDINDFRYIDIFENWENGIHLDPPVLSIIGTKISISDGRHRTICAYHIGQKCIPIAVPINFDKESYRFLLFNDD